jgi:hypothetical protein
MVGCAISQFYYYRPADVSVRGYIIIFRKFVQFAREQNLQLKYDIYILSYSIK